MLRRLLPIFVLCTAWCLGSEAAICKKATWKAGRLAVGAPEGTRLPYDYPTKQGWETVHFTDLRDFFVADDGMVYVVDAGEINNGIVRWSPYERLGVVVVGGGGEQWNRFGGLQSVLVSADGDITICDAGYRRISRWSQKTNTSQSLLNNVDCNQLFTNQKGEILYTTTSSKLFKWIPAENRTELVMKPAGKLLPGKRKENRIFLSQNGDIFLADLDNDRILKYTSGQNDAEIVAGGQTWQGAALTDLNTPVSVFVDDDGTLYIGDAGSRQVVRWDVASSTGTAVVKQPNVGTNFIVRFDRQGNLYAASLTSIVRYDIDTSAC